MYGDAETFDMIEIRGIAKRKGERGRQCASLQLDQRRPLVTHRPRPLGERNAHGGLSVYTRDENNRGASTSWVDQACNM